VDWGNKKGETVKIQWHILFFYLDQQKKEYSKQMKRVDISLLVGWV
jgi:hypothetical protein